MKQYDKWYDLQGRVVVLTGATGRLAPAYARCLSECGAHVVVIDQQRDKCEALAAELSSTYRTRAMPLELNVADPDAVRNGVAEVVAQFGRLDILINNAAYNQTEHIVGGKAADPEDFPLSTWQRTIDVNLTGTLLCCQEGGRQMLRQGGGVILNVSSVYGVVAADQRIYGSSGLNSNIAYATTKGGLLNFTRYLAAYWQNKNIRVNAISPGGVYAGQDPDFVEKYTYRTMLGRMADVDDLTAGVLYLVSDASKFVTGFNLVVDGGWTAW
jgi:NAD(P)-dependent dehydrogenase (short-subunit alcohol dehydrogenase family)